MNYKDNLKKGRMVRPTAKEMAVEMFDKKWPRIKGITKTELVNLRYGNYYQQLMPFFEVFGRERFIFLDGTNMGMIFNPQSFILFLTDLPGGGPKLDCRL